MAKKNPNATRTFSDIHEKSVCRALDALQTTNSGASAFTKGDVIQRDASLLVECKTVMSPKESISVKYDWIQKNKEEAFSMRLDNSVVCFNFEPHGENYYIISEKLMKFLTEKLTEENS